MAKKYKHLTGAVTDYVTMRIRLAENSDGKAMLGSVASESFSSHLRRQLQAARIGGRAS